MTRMVPAVVLQLVESVNHCVAQDASLSPGRWRHGHNKDLASTVRGLPCDAVAGQWVFVVMQVCFCSLFVNFMSFISTVCKLVL